MAAPLRIANISNLRSICTIFKRNLHVTKVVNVGQSDVDNVAAVDDDYKQQQEAAIKAKQDVCRLRKQIEPLLHSRARRRDPVHAHDIEIRNLRKEYARLGVASGIDPSIMWPTVDEIKKLEAWEQEWEPSLEEQFCIMKQKKQSEQEYLNKRSLEVAKNLREMPKLMKAFNEKQKRRNLLQAQQEAKRTRILEEAREYFGYEIDPRDPKFQEMAAKKEEEAKIAAKKEKRAKRLALKTATVTS